MKELKKMSLINIQGSLSKEEMKRIMAGSGGGNCTGHYWGGDNLPWTEACSSDCTCSIRANGGNCRRA